MSESVRSREQANVVGSLTEPSMKEGTHEL